MGHTGVGCVVGTLEGADVGTLVGDGVANVTDALDPSNVTLATVQLNGLSEWTLSASSCVSAMLTVAGLNVMINSESLPDAATRLESTELRETGGVNLLRSASVQFSTKPAGVATTPGNVTVTTTSVPGRVGLRVGAAVGNGVQNLAIGERGRGICQKNATPKLNTPRQRQAAWITVRAKG